MLFLKLPQTTVIEKSGQKSICQVRPQVVGLNLCVFRAEHGVSDFHVIDVVGIPQQPFGRRIALLMAVWSFGGKHMGFMQ